MRSDADLVTGWTCAPEVESRTQSRSHALRGRRTRGRVLEACRTLFNERDARDVTTAEIASAVGIAEGNVHYYFHYKEQMVAALLAAYEDELATMGLEAHPAFTVEARQSYISRWLYLMWDWRFAYSAGTYRVAPELRFRRHEITRSGQLRFRLYLEHFRCSGELTVSGAEMDLLLVNAWIVMSYWVDYLRLSEWHDGDFNNAVAKGVGQIEALLSPHLRKLGCGNDIRLLSA